MNPAADTGTARRLDTLIRTITWSALIGALLYLGLGLWVGWRDLWQSFVRIGFMAFALGLAASTLGYGLRFARWQWLLHAMQAPVPVRASLPIYVGGLALTATPGKVGETIRTLLLMRFGVPAGSSLAAFFIDRLSDLVGVLALAAIAGLDLRWAAGAASMAAAGFGLRWLVNHPRLVARLHTRHPHPRWQRAFALAETGRTQYLAAWREAYVPGYVLVAIAAYGAQSLVFGLYVQVLWPGIDLMTAVYIFVIATLVGAASMIPGGLGAMEVTMIAMLVARGVAPLEATAAAVAIRTVTLWFGILLGILNLMFIRKRV